MCFFQTEMLLFKAYQKGLLISILDKCRKTVSNSLRFNEIRKNSLWKILLQEVFTFIEKIWVNIYILVNYRQTNNHIGTLEKWFNYKEPIHLTWISTHLKIDN